MSGKALIKILVSAFLLYVVASRLDLNALYDSLSSLSLFFFLLCCALYCLGQIFSAVKWSTILNSSQCERSPWQVTIVYFVGMLVNTVGLGTVGGDATRAIALKPEKEERALILGSVLADRAHGLITLVMIGAGTTLIFQPSVFGSNSVLFCIVLLIGATSSIFVLKAISEALNKSSNKFLRVLGKLATSFPTDLKTLIPITVLSVMFHSLQILIHLLILQQLGADVSLGYLFCVIPLVNIISTLPISWNGIGVRETLLVSLLVPIGVPDSAAFSLGLVWVATVACVSIVFGLVAMNLSSTSPNLKLKSV